MKKTAIKFVFAASAALVGLTAQAGIPLPEPASDSGFSWGVIGGSLPAWIGIGGGLGTAPSPFPTPDPKDPFGVINPVLPDLGGPMPEPVGPGKP